MIALIDYGMGNLKSVKNALECLGAKVLVTSSPEKVSRADAIIVPGVGAFSDGMKNLHELGMIEALKKEVGQRQKPYLGICLGMQFLAEVGYESGETNGLGVIPGAVVRLNPDDKVQFKIPHMGWNDVKIVKQCPIFHSLTGKPVFYFVHSYHFEADTRYVSAVCCHGQAVTAAVWKDNIFGVQFHPEKSQGMGLKVLENFCTFIEEKA